MCVQQRAHQTHRQAEQCNDIAAKQAASEKVVAALSSKSSAALIKLDLAMKHFDDASSELQKREVWCLAKLVCPT